MTRKLYIVGAGSVGGHVALNISQYGGNYSVAGFFDDDRKKIGTKQFGYPVLNSVDKLLNMNDVHVLIGIAFPKTKRQILGKLDQNRSLVYPSFVHENAWVSNGTEIGKGVIIYPGTSVNYGSKIEDFVVLNMNCSLGHHTKIGTFSSFAPGVCTGGHTTVGNCVDVGIGAATIQNVKLGDESVAGGQSMIIRDVAAGTVVAGVPARIIPS